MDVMQIGNRWVVATPVSRIRDGRRIRGRRRGRKGLVSFYAKDSKDNHRRLGSPQEAVRCGWSYTRKSDAVSRLHKIEEAQRRGSSSDTEQAA